MYYYIFKDVELVYKYTFSDTFIFLIVIFTFLMTYVILSTFENKQKC